MNNKLMTGGSKATTHHSSKSVCPTSMFSQGRVPWAQNLQQQEEGESQGLFNQRRGQPNNSGERFGNRRYYCTQTQISHGMIKKSAIIQSDLYPNMSPKSQEF